MLPNTLELMFKCTHVELNQNDITNIHFVELESNKKTQLNHQESSFDTHAHIF